MCIMFQKKMQIKIQQDIMFMWHQAPAVFSHTGQSHGSIKFLITEQIRHKLILSEGEAK